jgi:hypothetical protein
MEREELQEITLSVSDLSELGSLQKVLGMAPAVTVSRVAGEPGPGEQGAVDVLEVLAGSSGLVTAIKVLPEFLRSRRTDLSITMTIRGTPVTLTAKNADDVMPILDRLLDA